MSYYNQLKSNSDINNIAIANGYNGVKSGKSWQGDCPRNAVAAALTKNQPKEETM